MSNTSGLGRVDSCREPPITLSRDTNLAPSHDTGTPTQNRSLTPPMLVSLDL
jgi:hypothetical protein